MTRNRPKYSFGEISRCLDAKAYFVSRRVASVLESHGYDVDATIAGVMSEIASASARFHKSGELKKLPGTWADIYFVDYDDETWYVKFYIEDGMVVWSCKPDGMPW